MHTKKVLLIIFLVVFLVMVGFGIIIPVLPFLAENVGATPTQLGWLMSIYSILQLIFAPIWGKISDKIGRKPVMAIGIFGLAFSFFVMAISNSLFMLFVARVIGGVLSSANIPTAMAYVADITTPAERSRGMGIVGAATGMGFVFGPAIGGIFSKTSIHLPFFIAGACSLITAILVIVVLKESLTKEKRKIAASKPRVSFLAELKTPTTWLFIMQLMVSLSMAGLEAMYAYFVNDKLGYSSVQLGYIFMIMGVGSAIVQGGLVGRMTKKIGEGKVIQLGIVVSAIGFILVIFSVNFVTAALFLTIFGMGNSFIRPAMNALVTKTSTENFGSKTGLLSSFDSLGRIIGPVFGGVLFEISIGLPFIVGAIVTLATLSLYPMFMSHMKRRNQTLAS